MKKIFLFLSLIIISCNSDEIEKQPEPVINDYSKNCPYVNSLGEDSRGDYIIITLNQSDFKDRNRYKVIDYSNYKLGQKICDTSNLIHQPL